MKQDGPEAPPQTETIKPLPFRPAKGSRPPQKELQIKRLVVVSLGFLFVILLVFAWYVFTAKQVVIQLQPEADTVSLEGGFVAPRIGNYYLLRPGQYSLLAKKQCYAQLAREFIVTDAKSQTYQFDLEKLPGYVTIHSHEKENSPVVIEGAMVFVDGEKQGSTPLSDLAMVPGVHMVEVQAETYQNEKKEFNVNGCGESQSLVFALISSWAKVTITSIPEGSKVTIDGKDMGTTPLEIELQPGSYTLELDADLYKTYKMPLNVEPGKALALETIRMEKADGILALQTMPAGASVMVESSYVGETPLDISLPSGKKHMLFVTKKGFENSTREIQLASGETIKIIIDLVAQRGIINLFIEPADASLLIDGKTMTLEENTLHLTAIEHRLEVRKEGYESFTSKLTPRPGFPQELRVALQKKGQGRAEGAASTITAANGYKLRFVQPGPFRMGASRREQGRRSNETLREIVLNRPFYMGTREVTNREFREFIANHNSGFYGGQSLSRNDQPVVQVAWEQAALFCNWLSAKESRPPSYIRQGDRLVAVTPLQTGYRLPTEAEWEYCARIKKNGDLLKYPWGATYPPRTKVTNIADLSARNLLANYVKKYDDGFPVSSPPASFNANGFGIFDMSGNVAEWCHDFYSIYSFSSQTIHKDPTGPERGKHWVVKGSSWKHSSITNLRASYRGYSADKREDLGFRICRYAQ